MIHALAWLLIGYSDGVIHYLMREMEISGYIIFVVPLVAVYVIGLVFVGRIQITIRLIGRQAAIAAFFIAVWAIHSAAVGSIYVAGYAQLFAMVSIIFLFTDLFSDNANVLRRSFGDAMLIAHYIISGYIVICWIVMRFFEVDISLFFSDFANLPAEAASRSSGLHREPSWAAYAVTSSYLGVFLIRRTRLWLPQIALLAALAATASIAGLVLAALLIGYQIIRSRSTRLAFRIGLLAGLAALTLVIFGGRIAGMLDNDDPSMQMRTESTLVAFKVISDSFPIGTGYGNYRDVADFSPEIWQHFIDLDEAEYYKSDTFIFNLVAEMGVFGFVLIILMIRNVFCRRSPLVAGASVVLMLSTGSLIIPYHLVLAALAGLEIARTRAEAGQAVSA